MASTMHPSHPPHSASHSFPRPSGDVASFSSSFNTSYPNPAYSHPYAHAPQQDGMTHPGSSFRGSFNENHGRRPTSSGNEPQIYTAVYSGVPVYEMEIQGTAVMRRRADSWLNATQILKVAQIEKGRRTKILEKEILTGDHEKVQGGYGRYQGTWISYPRGREFCRAYGVEDVLRPLLDYDIGQDGTGSTALDTPTKEQAQAANRKKLYNSSIDSRLNGIGSRNTFFQNISPTASTALAAMNKAARYESPMPRPGSAPRRPSGMMHRQSSSQQMLSQDSAYQPASQQSFTADHGAYDGNQDNMFAALSGQLQNAEQHQEPPRKRMRTSFGHDPYVDPMLTEETPTEPNESFMQTTQDQHCPRDSDQGFLSLAPLPIPETKSGEDKRLLLLELFAEPARTDFFSHPAIEQLSGADLDIPLDGQGNTALHWAGTLGKVLVIKALVSKGANLFRGNAGGATALMHAVQVNNTHQQNNFPEMLECLGPLIELRDATGRTVLHHIAVASGIKGRSQSSRYYLESLLAFTVRQGGVGSAPNSQNHSFADKAPSFEKVGIKAMNLARFMSEIVNIQDRCGNTALNLVSRIGTHAIINQLEEVGADFGIANHKGFRPESFGIFPKNHNQAGNQGSQIQDSQTSSGAEAKPKSQIDQIREEIFATTQSILQHTITSYTTALTNMTDLQTRQSNELRELEIERSSLQTKLAESQAAAKERKSQKVRRDNLRVVAETLKARESAKSKNEGNGANAKESKDRKRHRELMTTGHLTPSDSAALLRVTKRHNELLAQRLQAIKQLAASEATEEREAMCRRLVSLCTHVAEDEVDGKLDELLRAVEE